MSKSDAIEVELPKLMMNGSCTYGGCTKSMGHNGPHDPAAGPEYIKNCALPEAKQKLRGLHTYIGDLNTLLMKAEKERDAALERATSYREENTYKMVEEAPEPTGDDKRNPRCSCGAWICGGCLCCSSDCGCAKPNIPCDCWFKERQICDKCCLQTDGKDAEPKAPDAIEVELPPLSPCAVADAANGYFEDALEQREEQLKAEIAAKNVLNRSWERVKEVSEEQRERAERAEKELRVMRSRLVGIEDHLHQENDWGVCRICAQRGVGTHVEAPDVIAVEFCRHTIDDYCDCVDGIMSRKTKHQRTLAEVEAQLAAETDRYHHAVEQYDVMALNLEKAEAERDAALERGNKLEVIYDACHAREIQLKAELDELRKQHEKDEVALQHELREIGVSWDRSEEPISAESGRLSAALGESNLLNSKLTFELSELRKEGTFNEGVEAAAELVEEYGGSHMYGPNVRVEIRQLKRTPPEETK